MKSNKRISWIAFVLFPMLVTAQTLTDGIFMPKNAICGGFTFNKDQFKEYWEGTTLRSNANMGTMSMQSISAMANYGITNQLNIIGIAPYVRTQASAGVMMGMSGIQDLTLALKYRLAHIKNINIIAMAGGSIPLTNYAAAYPLAIGNQSKTLFGRAMIYYLSEKGWTFNAQSTYILRGNIKIDATNYYTDRNVFSDEVRMDNVFQTHLRGGYYSYRWATEMTLEHSKVLGGFDIRRNDMMFPANRQEMTRLGIMAFYRIKPLKDLQLIGNIAYTLSGRNVGKALSTSIGAMMTMNFNKKTETAK